MTLILSLLGGVVLGGIIAWMIRGGKITEAQRQLVDAQQQLTAAQSALAEARARAETQMKVAETATREARAEAADAKEKMVVAQREHAAMRASVEALARAKGDERRRAAEASAAAPAASGAIPAVPAATAVAAEAKPTAAPKGGMKTPPKIGHGEKIMVVDDEEFLASIAERMLTALGFAVQTFGAPEDARDFLQANPAGADLVITDMTMQPMSGLQLTAALLAIRPGLPVILTSGALRPGEWEEAQAAGVRDYLAKPADLESLIAAVSRALGIVAK